MFNIYFGNRRITACSASDPIINTPGATLLQPADGHLLKDVLQTFAKAEHPERLFIPTSDEQRLINELAAETPLIRSAGGLVRSREGEYLIIRRSGLWDLPKGWIEEGESTEEAAIREVREETGVSDLTLEPFLCRTFHTYSREGILYLKQCDWFSMSCRSKSATRPQLEEEITEAIWMTPEQIKEKIPGETFPSIIEVLTIAGLL